ncbi:MAG TPA: endolytic transglycosylase MltG [Jiangellales bacterium]|nr:endolytic transglycosylase MltG [Jiangellales bacterium]
MSQLGLIDDDHPPRRRRSHHHHRRRERRGRARGALAVIISLAVIGGLAVGVYVAGRSAVSSVTGWFADPEDYPGPGSSEVSVEIPEGSSLTTIGRVLYDAGVVASVQAFVDAAEGDSRGQGIQPGSYVLLREMAAADAVAAMLDATTVLERVTVPEGLRVSQTVDRLAESTVFPVEELQAAVDTAELPAYTEGDPEGVLFPATYDVKSDTTAQSLVAAMVSRFGQAAQAQGLEAGAAELGRTPREVMTVASIIQREVRRPEDLPLVADVIYNRLSGACVANGVPVGLLQMDSTVAYAVDDYSGVFTTPAARASDSPYNTYRFPGLPPGPIAGFGEEALAAALQPAGTGNCWFAAVDLETGETRFAVTEAEHAANVALLQAFCRESDLC